jgi:hypothetical protein
MTPRSVAKIHGAGDTIFSFRNAGISNSKFAVYLFQLILTISRLVLPLAFFLLVYYFVANQTSRSQLPYQALYI